MQDKIVPQQFMLLKRQMRDHLAKVFGIESSGSCEIMDQTEISDGRTMKDLSVITKEKMEEYVGSSDTFGRLWEITIAKAYSELNPPIAIIGGEEKQIIKEEIKPIKDDTKKNKEGY